MEKTLTESEKVEQLMRPRYKVIADFPKSPYPVGTVVRASGQSEDLLYCDWQGPRMRDYPHLFRKLEWWEERTAEEMPEYVKYAENGMVAKVDHFDLETTSAWFMYLEGGVHPYCPGGSALENTNLIPATHADYLAYTQPSPLNQEK